MALITGIVVVAFGLAVVASLGYVRRNEAPFLGWKGEMEVFEVTIEPEFVAPVVAASPRRDEEKQKPALPVAERSEFEMLGDEIVQPHTEDPDLFDVKPREANLSRSDKPVAYSQTFVILRRVQPTYPQRERERGLEGSVTVELLVDEQGLVARANALDLVGPASFQEAALNAVRQFVFQPPIINGQPSTMWIKFVVKFRLNN
jgi:TonB family protein